MNVEELFEKYDDEYIEFERIPVEDRLSENSQICALLYVYKLMKDPTKFQLDASHDVIWITHEDWLRELTDEDAIYLRRCGVHYADECLRMHC